MNEKVDILVSETSRFMPGIYTVEYEGGGKGVEFNDAALEKFVRFLLLDCKLWIMENAASMEQLGPEYFAQAMIEGVYGEPF